MNKLKNKVVVVTGASSGIGRATAVMLAKKGATVYGLSRRTVEDCFVSLSCDVTDYGAVEKALSDVYQREGAIHCLVNNAGTGVSGAVESIPAQKTMRTMDVNLHALMECSRLCLPYLKQSGGYLINVSSVAAVIPIPFQAAYSTAKAAVNAFTLALRNEVGPLGVKVCAVMPGDTKTSFTAARDKVDGAGGDYAERLEKSVGRMEKDEQSGKPPESVSRVICRLMQRKNPPPLTTVGIGYKCLTVLAKLLPTRVMLFVVKLLYG